MLVNLIGGFAIGMLQRGPARGRVDPDVQPADVGDGLVSQIPALLISAASGLIVTRSTTDGDMGTDAARQLLAQRIRAAVIAGGAAVVLALVRGMPKLPFVARRRAPCSPRRLRRRPRGRRRRRAARAGAGRPLGPDTPEANVSRDARGPPGGRALAPDLVDLVDTAGGGDLLERVRGLRRKLALELGLVDARPCAPATPSTCRRRTYVDPASPASRSARGDAPAGQVLALGDDLDGLPGRPAVDPVFGLAGKLGARRAAPSGRAHRCHRRGPRLGAHHPPRRGGPHATPRGCWAARTCGSLVEPVKRTHPVVVEELTPAALTLGEVQRGAAGAARRGRADPRPRAHLRGARDQGQGRAGHRRRSSRPHARRSGPRSPRATRGRAP